MQEKEISEESSERLNMRGIQLLKLIQCYGRLCFLQNKSVELRAGDEVLVQAMVEALDVLEGRDDDSSGSQVSVLPHLGTSRAVRHAIGTQWLQQEAGSVVKRL